MKITVQIVNYNSKKHLEECLISIGKNFPSGISGEVLIINNDSEDIRALLQNYEYPFEMRCLEINENIGFAKAQNEGAKNARGEFLFLLNPDNLVLPGFFERMLAVFEADPAVGLAGPILVGENGKINEEHCGFKKTPFSTVKSKFLAKKSMDSGSCFQEFDWVSGGALVIRKNLFFDLGKFDERYFMYFEDVDLCLLAKNRGFKIMVHTRAKVIHKGGKSFRSEREKKKYYYDSQKKYFKKNFGLVPTFFFEILRFPLYVKNVYLGK